MRYLIFMALENAIYEFFILIGYPRKISLDDLLFGQPYEICDVVELSFLEYSLFDQPFTHDKFSMPQIVKYYLKIVWISIDQEGSPFITIRLHLFRIERF